MQCVSIAFLDDLHPFNLRLQLFEPPQSIFLFTLFQPIEAYIDHGRIPVSQRPPPPPPPLSLFHARNGWQVKRLRVDWWSTQCMQEAPWVDSNSSLDWNAFHLLLPFRVRTKHVQSQAAAQGRPSQTETGGDRGDCCCCCPSRDRSRSFKSFWHSRRHIIGPS